MITWVTPAGSIGTFIEEEPVSYTFSATSSVPSNTIRYILVSGRLPIGTIDTPFRLSMNGVLTGLPDRVNVEVQSTFTVRAVEYNSNPTPTPTGEFLDRTFSAIVTGITPPKFNTPGGLLANIQDSVYFQYQIQYEIFDPSTTGTISLALGELPPGIELSTTGFLSGYPARPFDADGNPTITTYNFTLQLATPSGIIFNDYSITVTNQDINSTPIQIATGPNGITNTNPAVVITATTNNIITGQQIKFTNVSGITSTTATGITISLLNGLVCYAKVINDTTFEVYRDSALADPVDARGTSPYGGSGMVTPSVIRKPVLLNNQPLTTNIPYTEPNSPFYITGTQIGNVAQDSKFGFKFLGHDFEGRSLVYISAQTPAIGLIPDENTGWILGTVPHVGGVIETYSFNVQVAWASNPEIISNQYRFTLQVFGDIDSSTLWATNSNLGVIYNTTISTLSVQAISDAAETLSYRVVGYQTDSDLASISPFTVTGSDPAIRGLATVGTFGSYVSSVSSIQEVGTGWTQNPALTSGNINKIYSAFGSIQYLIIVGIASNRPFMQTSPDGVNWSVVQINPPEGVQLRGGWNDVTQIGSTQQYTILLGDNGEIYITENGGVLIDSDSVWTPQTLGDIANLNIKLNSVTDGFPNNSTCVVVGNEGTILSASESTPEVSNWLWTTRDIEGISVNLNSVIWTGAGSQTGMFIAVGDFGHVIHSDDGITWEIGRTPTLNNLNFVYIRPYNPRILTGVTIVGEAGEFMCDPVDISAPLHVGDTVELVLVDTYTGTGTITGYNSPQTYKITATNGTNTFTLGTNVLLPRPIVTTVGTTTGIVFLHEEIRYIFAGGDEGTLLRSSDGITWVDTNQVLTRNSLNDMVYLDYNDENKFYYIVGEGGAILKSEDGFVWTSPTLGTLPDNLYLGLSGNIIGRVNYQRRDGTPWPDTGERFNFRVQAYDEAASEIIAERDFTITVQPYFTQPYQNLYMHAYPSMSDRDILSTLTADTALINPQYLYRPDDPYFGIQENIVYQHLYGVDSSLVNDYISSIYINHYRRQITLGELKYAIARDDSGTPIYEAVYSSIIDNLVNNQGVSIPKRITWPRSIPQLAGPWYTSTTQILDSFTFYDPDPAYGVIQSYVNGATSTTFTLSTVEGIEPYFELTGAGVTNKPYPGKPGTTTPPVVTEVNSSNRTVTVDTVQGNNLAVGQLLFFNNPVYTSLTNDPYAINQLYPASLTNMRIQIAQALGQINDYNALPKWMTSRQANGAVLGYTPAWVLCYVKPGFGQTVIDTINNNWQYKLNQINFRVDRFEVDNTVCGNPPTTNNANDWYIIFSQKNILPNSVT